jgi:hypothetical protein
MVGDIKRPNNTDQNLSKVGGLELDHSLYALDSTTIDLCLSHGDSHTGQLVPERLNQWGIMHCSPPLS